MPDEVQPVETDEQTEKVEVDNGVEKRLAELEERNKFLSSELTRNQQENAQFVKLFKSRMDEFTPTSKKSFAETWEDSPEEAVASTAEARMKPILASTEELKENQIRLQSEMYLTQVMSENPHFKKYEKVVREDLGWKYGYKTKDKDGIKDLFAMAEALDPQRAEEIKKVQANGKAEMEKSRTYTEGASPREIPQATVPLTPEEKRIARKLNIEENDYVAFRDRSVHTRPKGWKSENQRAREKR